MTTRAALPFVLSALATALAWMLGRTRPLHRPLAALLTFGLLSDLVRQALQVYTWGVLVSL